MVIGVGQLDTCAPSVVIFCSMLEKMGIPTAPIITEAFPEVTRTFAYKKGMPGLRFTFVPHPFANRPIEVHRKYLEGNNPISGRPVIKEIIEALTNPLSGEEKKTGTIERLSPRLLPSDTPEHLERLFMEMGWTDYLPIVLPTEERVAEMLKGTSHKPDEVIGRMQTSPPHDAWDRTIQQLGLTTGKRIAETEHFPAAMQPSPPHEAWEYTVEHVAINAVMAGAKPEHLPVILAIASTGVTSLFSSATSISRMVITNGPIREQIKMNCGLSALGPFNQANAVIGRAWTLISKNLGGAIRDETYLGDIGNNSNYNNNCFAENEEALPEGWQPYHVQKGFNPGTQATFLLSPITSRDLKNGGFDTKEQLSQWLKENTYMSLRTYWDALPDNLEAALAGVEPFASLLKLPPEVDSPRPLILSNAPVEILVVGGGTDAFWMAGDFYRLASASVDSWR
jgi:hypothetical protein